MEKSLLAWVKQKKKQANFHKLQCSAGAEIEDLRWGFSLKTLGGVCFGEGLQEWQRSPKHLNGGVGRRTLTATHGAGSVHFTQINTHHVLSFPSFLSFSIFSTSLSLLSFLVFETFRTKLCRAWDLQVPHKITFEAELPVSVYQHQILSICLDTSGSPCFDFSQWQRIPSPQIKSDAIKSTNCDADTPHHWATEKCHEKVSRLILTIIWTLQGKKMWKFCTP